MLHKELIDMYLFSIDDLIQQQERQLGKAKPVCLAMDDRGQLRGYRLELIQILKTSKHYSPEEVRSRRARGWVVSCWWQWGCRRRTGCLVVVVAASAAVAAVVVACEARSTHWLQARTPAHRHPNQQLNSAALPCPAPHHRYNAMTGHSITGVE